MGCLSLFSGFFRRFSKNAERIQIFALPRFRTAKVVTTFAGNALAGRIRRLQSNASPASGFEVKNTH
jgi:hypothetical protein